MRLVGENGMKKNSPSLILSIAALLFLAGAPSARAASKNPEIVTAKDGTRTLVLPDDVDAALSAEFPGYRIPKESDYNPEMLEYFNSNLIGVYPAVAWGDFNGDRKRDYALLIITQDTKWGPLVELVVLNGHSRNGGEFDVFRLGEVYKFKNDYVSFLDGKLTKGSYETSAWYINWDKKNNNYVVTKS